MNLSPLDLSNRADQTRVFGLITLRGHFSNAEELPVRVDVRAGGFQASFPAEDCVFPVPGGAGYRVHANLMTHLMPNGATRAELELVYADGRRVAFDAKHLVIANDTALGAQVTKDLRAHGTEPILPRIVDSAMFPYQAGRAHAWFDFIAPEDIALSFEQSASIEDAHRHLERWGFCILPERLPPQLMTDFRSQLDAAIAAGTIAHEFGSSARIHGAHQLAAGRKIWLYPEVMTFLNSHFRDPPCACQTLTYVHGSEQNAHQDTIHLTPYPAGFMCGVWVALEDVATDSGELFVYPGSHKTQRLRARELGLDKVDEDYSSYVKFDAEVRHQIQAGGYERAEYRPQAGQILVWHENLVHGGSPRRDRSLTRLSIVSHYFAKGSVAYYDSRGEAAGLELLPATA